MSCNPPLALELYGSLQKYFAIFQKPFRRFSQVLYADFMRRYHLPLQLYLPLNESTESPVRRTVGILVIKHCSNFNEMPIWMELDSGGHSRPLERLLSGLLWFSSFNLTCADADQFLQQGKNRHRPPLINTGPLALTEILGHLVHTARTHQQFSLSHLESCGPPLETQPLASCMQAS